MLSVIKNTLWFLVGEIDETVGAVVPVAEYSSSSLKEMMVRLKHEKTGLKRESHCRSCERKFQRL